MATLEVSSFDNRRKLDINRGALEDLLKRRFFVCPAFHLYGGVAGLYDFGPPGCAVKANFLALWRSHFVLQEGMLEIDGPCVTPKATLDASGHTVKFSDFMVRDMITKQCHRADHILEDKMDQLLDDAEKKLTEEKRLEYLDVKGKVDDYSMKELGDLLTKYEVKAPETGNDISDPLPFNLMFQTSIGPAGDSPGFLRPELAQGIFVNFKRLLDFNGGRLPFAGAQIGQAFRNEICPRSGLLRLREFTLAEIEHFVKIDRKEHPKFELVKDRQMVLLTAKSQVSGGGKHVIMKCGDAVKEKIIDNETLGYFMARTQIFVEMVGCHADKIRFRQHLPNEMAHYAQDCWDLEMLTSYGWIECVGLADRSCYDLVSHSKGSGEKMEVFEQFDKPQVIEILEPVLNKGLVGRQYRQKAKKLLNFFTNDLDQNVANEINNFLDGDNYDTENGFLYNIDGEEFYLKREFLSFKKVTKKVHGESFVPHVIEPSFGVGRIIYACWEHVYFAREGDEMRGVLSLPPILAPVKVSVLPLQQDKKFSKLPMDISSSLTLAGISNKLDETGQSIGKRYARTDEIGIPFGITVDYQTLEDKTITLRERDSCTQIRISISEVVDILLQLIQGKILWKQVIELYPLYDNRES